MDNFLETYNPAKLNQEEINNLNRPITRSKTESVIYKLLTNKSPRPDSVIEFLWECTFLFSLLEEFRKDWYKFFLVCLVEFPSEVV